MSETEVNHPEYQTPHIITEIHTDGIKGNMMTDSEGIGYEENGIIKTFATDPKALELARILMSRPNEFMLASHVAPYLQSEQQTAISRRFQSLYQAFGPSHYRSHFLSTGSGSSTWYVFLSDNTNPYGAISRAVNIVEASETSERRRQKRVKPFHALEELYLSDKKSPAFYKKQLIGSAAVMIVVGGTAYFANHYRTRHKDNA